MDSGFTDIEKLIKDETFRNWALGEDENDFKKWETLLSKNEGLRKLAVEAKAIILITEFAEDSVSEQENQVALSGLLNKISNEEKSGADEHLPAHIYSTYGTSSIWTWMKYAAIFTVLVAALVFLYYGYHTSFFNTTPYKAGIEKVAPNGGLLTIRLPDGSKVRLNSNSKLVFPKDFSKGRVVRLTGEAFFDVTKNKKMPFRVITSNFTVEVLGTSFNINTYENEQHPKVSVVSGKVKVKMNNGRKDSLILIKNEAALFDSQKEKILPIRFDNEELLWRSGIIVFKNATIADIAQKLEQQFGVKVEISDAEKISGEFTGRYDNEELKNILEGTSYVLGFSYKVDESKKKVVIK